MTDSGTQGETDPAFYLNNCFKHISLRFFPATTKGKMDSINLLIRMANSLDSGNSKLYR